MLASNALTTISQAKSFVGIPEEDTTLDSYIEFSINSLSTSIENYCRRKFGLQSFSEFHQGRGTTKLLLDNYPIVELNEVYIDDQLVDITRIRPIADKGMLYRPDGGFPSDVIGGRLLYPRHDENLHNILVEYKAGYVLPKDDSVETPRNLPFDVELACLRMFRIMNKDREVSQGQNLLLKRETIGDWTGEYEPEIKSATTKLNYLDPDILATLDSYKRMEF